MGRTRFFVVAAIALIVAVIGSLSWSLPGVSSIERVIYDTYRYALAEQVADDPRITVVLFDEAVMRETGKTSPLDRKVLADALEAIDRMGAKAIGIDLMFAQPTPDDARLIAILQRMHTPTFIAFADPDGDDATYWGDAVAQESVDFQNRFWAALKGTNIKPVSPVLANDADGIARRWPEVEGSRPALAAAVANAPSFNRYRGSIQFARLKRTDENRSLNTVTGMFANPQITLFADPRFADAVSEYVRGRYVLIGADSFNIDQIPNPVTRIEGSGPVAGVYTHAHMLRQALSDRRPAPFAWPFAVLLCVVFAAFGGLTAAVDRRYALLVLAICAQATALLFVPVALDAMAIDLWDVPMIGALFTWLAAFLVALFASRNAGSEARHFAQDALGKYLPAAVARQIIADPKAVNLSGERRSLFIMFTDLQGFTKFSHALSPEATALILNAYLARMSEIILDHCGTIDKFVGDAIVAFWGAPLASDDDAANALACVLALDAAAHDFTNEQRAQGFDIGLTRIGLHHGEAVVGNFGAAKRIQYTAIGDAMNTAARLESANKAMGTRILVSEAAARPCGAEKFRPLGAIRLAGVATALKLFEPFGSATSAYAEDWQSAYDAAVMGDLAPLGDLQARHPGDKVLALLFRRLAAVKPGEAYELVGK